MRYQLLILLVSGVFVVGCGTTSQKDGYSTGGARVEDVAVTSEKSTAHKDAAAIPVKSEKADEPKAKDSFFSKTVSPLDQAIREQNDQQIFSEASLALIRNPKDSKALNAMAMYHYKMGRFDLSEYLLRQGIKATPNLSELHNNLGVVLLATQQNREAILAFRQAMVLNPNDPVAGANLGAIYVKEKDFSKAMFALDVAIRKGIKDSRTQLNYAVALTATGQATKAQKIYKDLLSENENNREALLNYSILLVDHLKQYKEGLELINRLKFVGGPADSRLSINELENRAKAGLK